MVDVNPLKIRNIDFQFDADTPYYWNPKHIYWGNFVNFVTLVAPGFEKYFIKAIRSAIPLINNPLVAEEADKFCRQEAQHSRHHIAHLKVLLNRYPGLEQVFDDVNRSYAALYQNHSMHFHLGYAAVVELCFGPLAKFIIENRALLFAGGNTKIASFILWHLVEEFEHRNSAYNVFNEVTGSYLFRLKMLKPVAKHLNEIKTIVQNGLNRHVPTSSTGIQAGEVEQFLQGTSLPSRARLFYELFCTQLPLHRPNNIKQPDWVSQWFIDEAAGVDMRCYYPK